MRRDQVRFSLANLKLDTGVGTADVNRRVVDFAKILHETPLQGLSKSYKTNFKEDINDWNVIHRSI